jgi:hypothetical protein
LLGRRVRRSRPSRLPVGIFGAQDLTGDDHRDSCDRGHDGEPLEPTTLLIFFLRQLQLTLRRGNCGFAALRHFDDNWRTGSRAQCLAELGQYLAGHLAARRLDGRADPLESLVESWSELLDSVMSNASAALFGRGSNRRNALRSLVRIWGNAARGLMGVRRDQLDGSSGQRSDAVCS